MAGPRADLSLGRAPTILETARLVGAPAAPEDADGLLALYGDPAVGNWFGDSALGRVRTGADARDIVGRDERHWSEHGFGQWVFRDRDARDVVARAGLHCVVIGGTLEVEVAWAVASSRWRQGFGTEVASAAVDVALGRLGLDSVIALTLPHNVASQGVARRAGFVRERNVVHAGLPHFLFRRR